MVCKVDFHVIRLFFISILEISQHVANGLLVRTSLADMDNSVNTKTYSQNLTFLEDKKIVLR